MNFDDYLQQAYDHQALNIDPSWGQGPYHLWRLIGGVVTGTG